MRLVTVTLSFVLALLGTSAFAEVCQTQQQTGCVELRVLNIKWDPIEPLLQGLDRPYRDQAERQDRMQSLAPRLWEEGFRKDKLVASKPRRFIIFFWNVENVSEGAMSAWQVNGDKTKEFKHSVSKSSFTEVKDGSYPTFDPVHDLGKPQKVYRIEASGPEAIGASLQIPWGMVGSRTYVLICSEDKSTVYPNKITANEGLWFTPETLAWLRDTRKSKRVLTSFVSKDG